MSAALRPTNTLLKDLLTPMVTVAEVQQILSVLPETEERLTWGSATFRMRNKIFAMIHPGEQKVTVKAGKSEQSALIATDPETYAPAPYTGRFGWVTVQLPSARAEDVRDLLTEAWCQTAPISVVEVHDTEMAL